MLLFWWVLFGFVLSVRAVDGGWLCLRCGDYIPSGLYSPCDIEHADSIVWMNEGNWQPAQMPRPRYDLPQNSPLLPQIFPEIIPPNPAKTPPPVITITDLSTPNSPLIQSTSESFTRAGAPSPPAVVSEQRPPIRPPLGRKRSSRSRKELNVDRPKKALNKFFIYMDEHKHLEEYKDLTMAQRCAALAERWKAEPASVKAYYTRKQDILAAGDTLNNPRALHAQSITSPFTSDELPFPKEP